MRKKIVMQGVSCSDYLKARFRGHFGTVIYINMKPNRFFTHLSLLLDPNKIGSCWRNFGNTCLKRKHKLRTFGDIFYLDPVPILVVIHAVRNPYYNILDNVVVCVIHTLDHVLDKHLYQDILSNNLWTPNALINTYCDICVLCIDKGFLFKRFLERNYFLE